MRSKHSLSLAAAAILILLTSCTEKSGDADATPAAADSQTADVPTAEIATPAASRPPSEPQTASSSGCAGNSEYRTEVDLVMGKSGATNILNVSFIGKQPPNPEIDRILRACVGAAASVDPSRDILATAWFRKNAGDDPLEDEKIDNYGVLSFLSYQASTKTIDVREISFNK
jgi:hypothetical protein